jgi:23S rRNA pseudouridine1911/1915/1917 synthase
MKIIFEDNDIIVLNKPFEYVVHSAKSWNGSTVIDKLKDRKIKTSGDENRQGIVHRLDVGTSGLLVVAKNEISYQKLIKQFKNKKVKKKYYALVQGYVKPKNAIIKLPIIRKKSSFIFTVNKNGKMSETKYNVKTQKKGFSFLDIELLTGRTHQIRVHFSYLNHPVVGDKLYGANPIFTKKARLNRQFLHSYYLSFNHPVNNKKLVFETKLPTDLKKAYDILMKNE